MSGLVLDASVTACWLLPDEDHPVADEVRRRLPDMRASVPGLWWYEIRNLLLMAERRGRTDRIWTAETLDALAGAPIDADMEADGERIFDFARRHRLTFYDAAYLELAARKGLPLATLDGELRAAARAEGIALL